MPVSSNFKSVFATAMCPFKTLVKIFLILDFCLVKQMVLVTSVVPYLYWPPLEFDVVFLPGWEEGLFPHQKSIEEKGQNGLEEERRLAYVGITRAKKKAIISFSMNRFYQGDWIDSMASRLHWYKF